MTEMPVIHSIDRIVEENPAVKTFFFKGFLEFEPGQFVMLWLPGVDEKPFTVSIYSEEEFAITIEKKGHYTGEIHKLKPGDKLGVRGPYGNPFEIVKGNSCIIGGGCGIAPVMPLIENLENPTVIMGCQSKSRLLFHEKINNFNVCTDDGTHGYKGFVTEKFKEILKNEEFNMVYTCGPEMMMKAVFDICEKHDILCQASLERFMICGIGVCGQCMCDNLRICKDGPVLGSKQLTELKDFGHRAMIKTGEKVKLKDYYAYRTRY